MSKSRGNVVAPDTLVDRYGADTVRAYLMFFARWELGAPWNSSGIDGTSRWLRRVWTAFIEPYQAVSVDEDADRSLRRKLHQTLRSVTRDFKNFQFNTIVSGLMELMNEVAKARTAANVSVKTWNETVDVYLRMLAPICPHIAEELWAQLGKPYSVHTQKWPEVDEATTAEEMITIPVQINGKLRDRVIVPAGTSDEDIKAAALASEAAQKFMEGKPARQVIYVRGRLVNIVV